MPDRHTQDAAPSMADVKELFGLMLEADALAHVPPGTADDATTVHTARRAFAAAAPPVRAAVERLLAAHGRASGMLLEGEAGAAPPGLIGADPPPAPAPRIAGYAIGQEIGRGGFGVVYRARQIEPVERPVAVKILRTELAGPDVIARFRAEARVLARMSHPGIARVLDAGLDDRHRPYVTMELVDGEPITAYGERRSLSVRERVRLLAEVCDAVHHAHQRAVIHRDLKPANVLVEEADGRHRPHVIDFGIAKIIEDGAGEAQTQTGARLGTPRYMSPEQVEGSDPGDVRTDVYALGVLLCEVLTGRLPRSMPDTGGTPAARRSTVAERPSRLAARGGADLADRTRELRGDLDRIVLKAVAFDAEERYDSAAAMAEDLHRYLDGRPVLATPPGVLYLARKFIARRKMTSAAIALAVVSMVGGTAAAMYGQSRAQESRIASEVQKRRAELEATVANEINDFWIDIIQRGSPQEARRPDLQVRDALDLAAPRLDAQIHDPGVRRRLHETFAQAYHALGLAEPQFHHARQAWSLLDASEIDDPADVLRTHRTFALALMEVHRLDEARTVLRAALDLCTEAHADSRRQRPLVLQLLAGVADRDGDFARAERLYADAAASAHEILGADHVTTLASESRRALILVKLGRAQEVIERLPALLETQRVRLGADHPDTISTLATLAGARQHLGQFEQAERDYATVLELAIPVLGEDHASVLMLRNNLASLLRDMRRFEEAESIFRAVRASHLRGDGPDHPSTLRATANLAAALTSQRKYEESESLLLQAIDGRRRVLGPEHPDTINAQQVLASVYRNTGRLEDALDLYAALLEPLRRSVPPGHLRLAPVLRNYGVALYDSERFEEALHLFIESYGILLAASGPEHPQTIRGAAFICDALARLASADGFEDWRQRCAE
ncbi:MAG: serine/threonine protein kinase [Phycisphaeraceae bacterium]|nr:serine/threonine protein kinase [Phycisphaeraceae bacterium]